VTEFEYLGRQRCSAYISFAH